MKALDFLDGAEGSAEDFLSGVSPHVKPPSSWRRVADVGISAVKGVIGVPESIVGLADIVTGGRAGKLAEEAGFRPKEAKAILDEYLSPQQQAANKTLADTKGFFPTVGAALQNPSTILHSAVESLPLMGAGGVAARGLVKAAGTSPWVAGAVGEGLASAGQNAEQVRQETPGGLLSPGQAATQVASGFGTGALALAGAGLARKLKIADIDTWIAQGKLDAPIGASGKGFARRLAEGAISEGVFEELPQSLQEQMWQNYALDKPIMQGVPEAGAMGMLTGAVMGGPAAALAGNAQPVDTPPKPQLNPREKLLNDAAESVIAQDRLNQKLEAEARQAKQEKVNDRQNADTAADQAPAGQETLGEDVGRAVAGGYDTGLPDQELRDFAVSEERDKVIRLAEQQVARQKREQEDEIVATQRAIERAAGKGEEVPSATATAFQAAQRQKAEESQRVADESAAQADAEKTAQQAATRERWLAKKQAREQAISGVVQPTEPFMNREQPAVVNDTSAQPVANAPETRQNEQEVTLRDPVNGGQVRGVFNPAFSDIHELGRKDAQEFWNRDRLNVSTGRRAGVPEGPGMPSSVTHTQWRLAFVREYTRLMHSQSMNEDVRQNAPGEAQPVQATQALPAAVAPQEAAKAQPVVAKIGGYPVTGLGDKALAVAAKSGNADAQAEIDRRAAPLETKTPPAMPKKPGTVTAMELRKRGESVESPMDAARRMSDGERIFAQSEQDGKFHEITSVEDIKGYTSDQLMALPPQKPGTIPDNTQETGQNVPNAPENAPKNVAGSSRDTITAAKSTVAKSAQVERPTGKPEIRIFGQLLPDMTVAQLQHAVKNAAGPDWRAAAAAELKTRDKRGETAFGKTVDQLNDGPLAMVAKKHKNKELRAKAQAEMDARAVKVAQLADRVKVPGIPETLKALADEAGWEERGGHLIRQKTGEAAGEEILSRTKWIPRAEWWPGRPVAENEQYYRAAVGKAIAGEKLTGKQAKVVAFMLDLAEHENGFAVEPETSQTDVSAAQELVDNTGNAPDGWGKMTEDQKDEELDSLFGEESRPVADAQTRSPVGQGEVGQAGPLELATQTEADLAAKAARENDQAAADRARIKRESEAAPGAFQLQPDVKPTAVADAEGAAKTGDLFAQPAEQPAPEPAQPLTAADHLEAAAKLMREAEKPAQPNPEQESRPRVAESRQAPDSSEVEPGSGDAGVAPGREGGTAGITDFGEKIGGARKDTAQPLGTRGKADAEESAEPGWRKRFSVSQIAASMKDGEVGQWVIHDARTKDWRGQPRQVGNTFASKESAEKAIPLIAVAQKHRVVPVGKMENGIQPYEIWRDVTDRKRVKVVDQQFATRDDAMRYMAEHAVEIIETKTGFGEEILAVPDKVKRTGAERRTEPATKEMFADTFGFRGVEFGLWNNQDERQDVMNHAYDGLLDLADVLNVPAKALSLNGDLALAFGARGQGLSGAKAHYERDYGVINLTKMTGAGSLAHEWLHAADHYLGRQDTKAKSEKIKNARGDMVYPASTPSGDMASHGFSYKSQVRPELRAAYENLIQTMFTKAEQYVEDTERAEKFVGKARESLANAVKEIRLNLTRGPADLTYMKRNNNPASAEQLATFDQLADKLLAGQDLETRFVSTAPANTPANKRGGMSGRWSNDTLEGMSAILKAVRGRQGFSSEKSGPLDGLRYLMKNYRERINMLASATTKESKTKRVPTSYAMENKRIDQGRASDYWTTEHEMAARAFSAYVEDKIGEQGNQSDFLAYGSNNDMPQYRMFNVRPFPEGAERVAINQAFDKFFGELKTRETDKGVAMFSQTSEPGPGLPAADIRAHLSAITDRLSVAVPVYDSVEAAREAGFSVADDAQGFAVGDQLGLVSENIKTLLQAEITAFHELWHVGIKRVTSDRNVVKAFANYNAALNRVAAANPEVRRRALAWREKYGADKRKQFEAVGVRGPELDLRIRLQSFDEAIAEMAGERRGKPVTRLNELIAALQRLLRALGFDRLADWAESVTDAEVLSLIRSATQAVSKDTVSFGNTGLVEAYHRAWHGSPHTFDEFKLQHIGSGEGAQAYGWGMYFAGARDVAQYYSRHLGGAIVVYNDPRHDGKNVVMQGNTIISMHGTAEAANKARDKLKGKLYQVELAPTEDQYLDWDKPLSEQSEKVRAAIQSAIDSDGIGTEDAKIINKNDSPGSVIYRLIAMASNGKETMANYPGAEQASRYLNSIGIPGIKYLDGSSRGRGEGNHNYVIFDDSHVKVVESYSRLDQTGIMAGRELQPNEANREITDKLQAQLRSEGHDFTITPAALPVDVAEDARGRAGRSRPKNSFTLAERISGIFGKQIVWITADDGPFPIAGVVRGGSELAPYVFIDVRANDSAHVVLGHELTHHIQHDAPEVYKALVDSVSGLLRNHEEYRRQNGLENANPDELTNEMIGDLLGNNFGKREFWNRVAKQSPGTFRKIADTIKQWLDNLIQKVTGQDVDQFVTDIHAARKALAQAVVDYAESRKQDAGKVWTDIAKSQFSRLDQTQTAEFKAWFGDSVVTDTGKPGGKPLVVYHGQQREGVVEAFADKPTWFIDNPDYASTWANLISPNEESMARGVTVLGAPKVYPAYLSVKNPYLTSERLKFKGDAIDSEMSPYTPGLREFLEKRGYDGIKGEFRNGPNGPVRETIWVAFRPEQIKSAIGNRGTFDPGDPNIMHSRGLSWEAPEPSKIDNLIYSLQDKQIDTKRVLDQIRKHAAVSDTKDVRLQEELYHGRTAKLVDDFLATEMKPLVTEMVARKVTMPEFEEYLHARHAEEANAVIAARNQNMPDGGSGMDTQDARDYLSSLDPAKKRAYEALAQRIDAMNAGSRQMLVDYGLESQDTIDAWKAAYKNYVPLHREDMGGGPGIGQGFSVRGPASKMRTGSSRKVVNIIANIAMQREKNIVRGEKNRVALALYGLAKDNPNPDFWSLAKPGITTQISAETGDPVEVIDMSYQSRNNVVMSRMPDKTGKIVQHGVEFNEHDERAMRMAAAMKNLDMDDLGHVLGMSAKITRYFASVNTQYNPVFGVVNIVRDVQGAMFNLSSTELAGHQSEVLKNTLSALRGIYIDTRDTRQGKPATSAWAQLWEEFQRVGGKTGYRDMFRTGKDRAEAIEREISKVGEGKAKQFGRAVFDWLSDYNTAGENAVRLAAYKVGIDQGMTRQRAASLAKNLTVNFNRKGQIATQAGALYAFFNASVQGTARLAETLTGPAGRKIIIGGITLGAIQALMLAAAGFDDDEPPEFIRERSTIIPIGDKKYITIPMPLGLHFIPNIGRVATEFALSGFKAPAKRVMSLTNVFADAFNPVGSAGLSLQTITPTAIDPIAALAENKDWTGKPIARLDMSQLSPTPGHTRAKDTASVFSKATSKALNYLSGGTDYKPGMFSPTPDQIDYLIGQATGGVGRETIKLEQSIASAFTGEDLPTYKIPLVGRFYGDSEQQSSQGNAFYGNLKEINEHEAEIKGRRKAGEPIGDYFRENPEARLVQYANAMERNVSALRKRKRELMAKDADPGTVKAVDLQITARMKQFNDRVKQVRASAP